MVSPLLLRSEEQSWRLDFNAVSFVWSNELDDQELTRESQQADLVSAWVSGVGVTGKMADGVNVPDPVQTVDVSVRNASQLPVFQVILVVYSDWSSAPHDTQRQSLPVMAPDSSTVLHIRIDLNLKPYSVVEHPPTELAFVDTAGLQWRRDRKGMLKRVDPI